MKPVYSLLFIGLSIALFGGCSTPIKENVFFSSNLQRLENAPQAPADAQVTKTIPIPIDQVRTAAQLILQQHALMVQARRTDANTIEYKYLDRTTFSLGGHQESLEMAFGLVLQAESADSTATRVNCLWNVMTDDAYRKAAPGRFAALQKAMLSQAVVFLDQLNHQSSASADLHVGKQ